MRLGGRLGAAIEVLDDIETRHRPAADAMRDWGLSHRFAGSGDRAAVGNLVYDALRRRHAAAWLLDDDSPRALILGSFLLENRLNVAALEEALAGDPFAPAQLSEREREALAGRKDNPMPDTVRANVPEWCLPLLKQVFGEAWVEECAALCDRPPLDLRANTLKGTRDRVVKALARHGAEPTRIAPQGVRIPPIEGYGRHPSLQGTEAFQRGWFEVQDEGSQIVAELAGAESGMQVLDYCAGAGGKTLACSARMQNRGQIFAFDADPQRLMPIHERIRRAGCRNVQIVFSQERLVGMEGQFDLVLVDAPCTGSGTWRRRPDAKWRLSAQRLETRVADQSAILDAVSPLVKPGGVIAYITCSIFEEENGRQVEAFLRRNPAFELADHDALWRARFPHASVPVRISANGITLTPATTDTDGFFFAMLGRRGH